MDAKTRAGCFVGPAAASSPCTEPLPHRSSRRHPLCWQWPGRSAPSPSWRVGKTASAGQARRLKADLMEVERDAGVTEKIQIQRDKMGNGSQGGWLQGTTPSSLSGAPTDFPALFMNPYSCSFYSAARATGLLCYSDQLSSPNTQLPVAEASGFC